MKMVFVCYSEALDGDVMDVLRAAGAEHYTKWTRVHGSGASSGPHLLSHIWPKGNSVVMAGVSDAVAAAVLDGVRVVRRRLGHEGVKAFSLPVDDVTA